MAVQPPAEFVTLQRVVAGRYSLERELGRGGMGVVFLARDVALDRPVAIKLLPPALAALPDLRERFLREARTAAGLSHPNIVPIHAVEQHGDLVFFVMGFVDGESLGHRVRRAGPLPASVVIRVVQEVAWALAYAHGRGVIHRDIKPDNILLEKGSGRALVTDFGIARVVTATGVTGRGEILGTAHYMAPEQARGDPIDGRSDVYALGVTAFFALTGTLPFDGPTMPAVLARALTEPPPPLATRRAGLPARLTAAVDRCLEKAPAERFATGEALAEAIGAVQAATRDAPPQIRHLIRIARELDVWLGFVAVILYFGPMLVETLWQSDPTTLVFLGLVFAAQVVVGPASLFTAMRRTLKAGLGPDDVEAELERAIRARIEEDEVVIGGSALVPSVMRRRVWRGVGLGLAAGGAAWLTLVNVVLDLERAEGLPGMVMLAMGGVILIGTVVMKFAASADKPADEARRRRAMGVTLRLLRGRVGRWLFRLAGIGLDTSAHTPPPATERTEILVGGAADALFKGLPSEVRRRFAGVPAALRRLEKDAQLLRDRERALAQALAQAAPEAEVHANATRHSEVVAELTAAREATAHRLAAAVAALENIRLDLLRLQAGIGSADDLTADLDKARAINEAVSADLAGRQEVEKILGQDRRRDAETQSGFQA